MPIFQNNGSQQKSIAPPVPFGKGKGHGKLYKLNPRTHYINNMKLQVRKIAHSDTFLGCRKCPC